MNVDKQILTVVCQLASHVRCGHLWILEHQSVLALVLTQFMVVYLHILQSINFLALLATDILLQVAIEVAFRYLIARVEETRAVLGPSDSAEFDPHELIIVQVLASLHIPDVEGLPVGPALLLSIRHVLPIFTPVRAAELGFAVSVHGVGVKEQLCILERITRIDPVTPLFFDSVPLSLGHKTTIIPEVVKVTVLTWNTNFWKVPIISNSLFKFVPRLTLLQEQIRQLILNIHPRLDLLTLSVLHIAVWIRNLNSRAIGSRILGELRGPGRQIHGVLYLSHVEEVRVAVRVSSSPISLDA